MPPAFNASNYKTWKTRIQIWENFTDVPKKKRAFVIALTAVGEIPDIIENLIKNHKDELSTENGVQFLLLHLDEFFGRAAELDLFDRFMSLVHSKRSESQTLADYVASFRTRFESVASEDLNLQSICSLLLLANGTFDSHELALLKSMLLKDKRIADLKVDTTCSVVKTVLVDSTSSMVPSPVVKSEGINSVSYRGNNSESSDRFRPSQSGYENRYDSRRPCYSGFQDRGQFQYHGNRGGYNSGSYGYKGYGKSHHRGKGKGKHGKGKGKGSNQFRSENTSSYSNSPGGYSGYYKKDNSKGGSFQSHHSANTVSSESHSCTCCKQDSKQCSGFVQNPSNV